MMATNWHHLLRPPLINDLIVLTPGDRLPILALIPRIGALLSHVNGQRAGGPSFSGFFRHLPHHPDLG